MSLHALSNLVLMGVSVYFMYQAEEKLNIETEAYRLKIEEAPVKGEIKSSSAWGPSTVTFQNLKLKDILENLLQKDKKLLSFNGWNKEDLLLNIRFEQITDTHNRKEIILSHLQEVYAFDIKREKKLLQYFDVQLKDSLLLRTHQSLPDTSHNFTSQQWTRNDSLLLENAHRDYLLLNLNNTLEPYFVSEKGFPGLNNFNLPIKSIESLKQSLQENYGLDLVQKTKEIEHISVEPQQKKLEASIPDL